MKKINRFILVGILNSVFGYFVYVALFYIGLDYAASLTVATAAGIIFNYKTSSSIVFKSDVNKVELFKFTFSYGLTYTFNLLLLPVLIISIGLNPYVAQLALLVPTAALTWILLNKWVYKK